MTHKLLIINTFITALSLLNFLPIANSQVPALAKVPKYTDEEIFKRAKIFGLEKVNERFDCCFTYAITYHLGIVGQAPELLQISSAENLIKQLNVLDTYYKEINFPCTDCLIVYKKNPNEKITHFGIVQIISTTPPKCTVRSKWGHYPYILDHKLFEVPKAYGNIVSYFILKPEFQKNRPLFLSTIQACIAESPYIQSEIRELEAVLLQLANKKNVQRMTRHAYTAHCLLKTCMGLNINTLDPATRETVLILATKRNNLDLIHLFLSMGADKTKQDIHGNTALTIAQRNNFVDAIKLLECDDVNLLI